MVTNTNKVTLGGSWLLLTLLMVGMSWSAAVAPVTEQLETSENDGAEPTLDPLALPDSLLSPADYDGFGYDAANELIGSRTETTKTYVGDDGDLHAIVSPVPVHYLDNGVWEEINLNLESTESGWSVTENTYQAIFGDHVSKGVEMVVDGQTIRYGVSPMVVVLDEETLSPHPYVTKPASAQVDVGGNVIRYPVLTGIDLDYRVTPTQLKQNLILSEAPILADHQKDSGYFGLAETMYLPTGYALFLGESPIAEGDLVKTNQSLAIRNLETGDVLVNIPQPLVESVEPTAEGVHIGEYIIRVDGEQVMLITVVENTWLMDADNRTFPIVIDPTLDKGAQRAGYAYYYRYAPSWWWYSQTYEYAFSSSSLIYTCRGANSNTNGCMSSSDYPFYYRYGWYRFNLNNALPTGATVNDVDFKSNVGRYRSGARNFDVTVLKSGSSQSSNMIDPSSYLYSSGRYLNRYIRNSAASSSSTSLSDPGYYWSGGAVRSIAMNSNGISDVQDAVDGNAAGSSGSIIGLGLRNTAGAPYWYWCSTGYYSYYGCTGTAKYPHLHIDYSGGSDTDPPEDEWVAYTGLTTHRDEQRTFWFSLRDQTGVDTTASGAPTLNYRVNNGSYTAVTASTLGTCLAGYWCNFRAVIPAVTEGDYVQYFLAFQDLKGTLAGTTGNPNFKTLPVGGTGSPSSVTAPTTLYNYFVQPVEEADAFSSDGTKNNKWQIKIDQLTNYRYYSVYRYFDEQLTYYEDTGEYIWEYDTSTCSTGSYQCFNSGSSYEMRYSPSVSSYSYSNCAQTATCQVTEPAGGMTMNGVNGPGMSTIWFYNAAEGAFAVVGLDSSTGIDQPVAGTSVGTQGGGRNCDDCYSAVPIPGDITMKFGSLTINASFTSSTTTRNYFCTNSNNHPLYFASSSSSNPYCLYSYSTYRYDRQFNGWMAPGFDGRWSSNTDITQKVSTVRPQPDIYPPELSHGGFLDTHSEDARTLTVGMQDAGDPPSGMNVSSGTDANGVLEGPHMQYRIYDAEASTWSAWTVRSLNQEAGKTRAQCEFLVCDWSTTIPGTDRGNTVEYSIRAKDNRGNWNNTTASSYLIATPTKVFTIEWHDQNCGFGSNYMCSWQVKMYDVTNEVEYLYDTNSYAYYDYQSIGYQKGGSSALGATLKERGTGFVGANPFSDNYRFATDGNNHASESFGVGMTELYNYDEILTGTSTGRPYGYYCQRYWSSYRNQCAKVIDLPTGFDFDYFGTTYSGNSSDKMHINRFGAASFSQSSSTTPMQMTYYYWYSQWPTMPTTTSYARNVQLAPWFGYYASYYCYDQGNSDCSIRTKTIPFDGAGMDVYADISTPTVWDHEMSPIRIVPSGDYIRVTADLTIEPGVEVQFAPGKGIDMAGACNKLTVTGNATHRNTITNLGNGNGKGFAFTNGGCTTLNTDERHNFEMVDISNLDVAISAGSRHGSAPHYNGNVGNFTLDDVTFTDVGTAIKHGSGGGTGFDLSGVSITNATASCVDLPDDASLTWVEGTATNCNTNLGSSDGGILTGDGSSINLENVDFVDSAQNGIIGGANDITLSNVSMSTSGLNSFSLTGTSLGQTGTQTSGTSLSVFNLNAPGYANGIDTHATDDVSIDTFTGGGIQVAPGGASANVLGATGWALTDVTTSGNVILMRTNPATIDNLDAEGFLQLSGTAASSDQVTVTTLTADGISVLGCGWNVRADDVTLGGGSAGTWATASCTSSSARSTLTVVDGTMAGGQNNGDILYARNGKVTVADVAITGQTTTGAYVAKASGNGDIRMIGVSWQGNDCAGSTGWAGMSTCWVDASSSSADIYIGGLARVGAYRVMNFVPVFVADHAVSTTVVTSSGTCPGTACVVTPVTSVGTTYTDGSGNATVWLLQDRIGLSGGSTQVTDSYTDHAINVAGGAGQNETGPADVWYTTNCVGPGGSCALPISPGDQIYLKLEAFPQDWGGATKDCAWLATNTSSTNGYYLYTMQLITLSTNLVLDGCNLHLNGTKFSVNRTSTNNPTITLKNGATLLLTEGGGEVGNIRAVSSNYGWNLDIQEGGVLTVDEGYLRDANQNSNAGGALLVGSGATVNLIGGAVVYGAQTVSSSMATIKVDGGTLNCNDCSVYNAQQSGVGIWLENTASSVLTNVNVAGADTGLVVKDAAPAINGFTLTDNTVGVEIDGGMTLPSIYRSTILSGQSRGWQTHEIDLTALASNFEYVQFGFNQVYMGGNAHPQYNYYSSRYFSVFDRMRIAVNDGYDDDGNGVGNELENFTLDAAGKQMTGYYSSGDLANEGDRLNPNHPSRNDGWARYDCNLYGYQYSPGGSYQYGYYYYFNQYGPYTQGQTNYYGANAYPSDFGFTLDIAEGLTGSQNYYPYMYWGYYWPSWYFGSGYQGGIFTPPEGFNGLWGYYNVCLSYAYRAQTPTPNGYRVSWPIVDTSSASIEGVSAFIDVVHNGADYFGDRMDFVFRGGNTIQELMDADWGREFGKAAIENGVIDGSDTGIEIGGNWAAADFDGVTINSPNNEGLLVSGSSASTINDLTVNGGRYGIRMTQQASGSLSATNSAIDNSSQDGVVLSKKIKFELGGTISNASNAGVNVLASSGDDWDFDGLVLQDNNIGLLHGGSGTVSCTECDTGGNAVDVQTSGTVDWVEGNVDITAVTATGSGLFKRARLFDLSLSADTVAVAGAGVSLLDADSRKVDNGKTDASGTAAGLKFYSHYVDASGHTIVNLAGYTILAAAKVTYTSTVADFRYSTAGVSLTDAPGNTDSVALVDNFDARVCYSWTSTSYAVLQSCAGSHYLATGSSRTKYQQATCTTAGCPQITEYGYYQAMPSNMQNKAVQIDSPYAYAGSSGASFNGSTLIFTGFYNDEWSDLYVGYPYTGYIYTDDTYAAAVGPKGSEFMNFGYYGGYNYGNFMLTDTEFINLGAIGSGYGYYNRAPVVHVTDSTIVSYSFIENLQSVYPEEICVQSAGNKAGDWIVDNNTFYDCEVAVMIYPNYYATSTYYGGTGTDGAEWTNNTVYDSTYLPFWIYLNSDADDLLIDGNEVTGSYLPPYAVYAQDNRLNSVTISNNILTGEEPIYMRNAQEWDINNNTIYGDANPAHSGIYVRNGHGSIADNTLIDSDGGINVFGVRSGYDVDIERNTIGTSGGRINPIATGIFVENCGLATINMAGNDVTTTSNALISDGCHVSDVGSSFNGDGGSAATIASVDIEASQYNPSIKNISTGDTVRWILTAYNSDPNNFQHSVTSNTSLFDSTPLNLGATFSYTFTTAGSYEYHCTLHTWMSGVVNVANSTGGSNLATLGIDIIGGSEDISFDGTAISGFSNAYRQDGGSLNLEGNALVTADNGFDLEDVDVTIDGATVNAAATIGTGISAASATGRTAFDATDLCVTGGTGVLLDGHEDFRWNGGCSSATTTLQTLSGASGTIENMSWATTTTQINAGAYSTITSVGNVLNQSQLTIGTSAVVHEGNLLDLDVTHMGGAASNVGLMIKSTDNGRSEYVSPSWRSNIIAVGEGAGGAAAITDWFVSHPLGGLNLADDAMPGPIAVNPDPTSQAMMYATWDNSNLYLMLTGVTFTLTDGMVYLDTRVGGSTTGDNWYVSHNLPFEADFMLWAEDLNNWGIRKVMPGGNWIDTTAQCSGMQAAPGFGIPGVTATFSGISEFAIPWDCIGSPTGQVRWNAIVQNENTGHVLGIYPPQWFNQTCGCAQTISDFGTLQLQGSDLATGALDDFLLIHRTFTQTGVTTPREYDVTVKVRDADNYYWDWGNYDDLSMSTNQQISIDILRAKPAIQDLVDINYDEDTGSHVVSLTTNAADYQQPASSLTWTVVNDLGNPSIATSPYQFNLVGQDLTISTDPDEFGQHRLYLTVRDGHGLYSSQSILVGVDNVNDKPIIDGNPSTSAVDTPVFFEDTVSGAVNVYDEPQRRDPTTGLELTWDTIRKDLGSQNGAGFISDLVNEQDAAATNNAEQAPQTYTWSAVTDPADCTPFSVSVIQNTLEIDLNEANEAGGTCNIVLDLSDGASFDDAADTVSVPFTINPVNDAPHINSWNVTNGAYIETSYVNAAGDTVPGKITDTTSTHEPWYWMVEEDTTDTDLLTISLDRMSASADNDHTNAQLTWQAENLPNQCNYEHYFDITIDNDADTLSLDLIPDATTNADITQWDMLQDADGDGVPDGGIHQKMPPSGSVYCVVKLWMNDTASAPPEIDYAQSTTGVYTAKSDFEYLYILVDNIDEMRPDYNFDEVRIDPPAFDFKGIDGVLADTSVPVSVSLEHEGDPPINPDGSYKYDYDLTVSFYVADSLSCSPDTGTFQSSVRLGSNGPGNGDQPLPGYLNNIEVEDYVVLKRTSNDVCAFVDVHTVNPFTGQYTDNTRYDKPELEERNWADNNMSTLQTNTVLPMIVELRAPESVASFAPSLMAVGLVGIFVGALLSRAQRDEDDEEFEEENLLDDDSAVSPVIATILLVAITVVLAGVIYVWAGSLADVNTKAPPRMTFTAEPDVSNADQGQWHWKITTTYDGAHPLASQAVMISVLWNNDSGQQVYKTAVAPGGGDSAHVYGFAPRNSDNMVTFFDDISACQMGNMDPCITTFGVGDRVFIRMTDNDGLIDSAQIDISYELPGGAAYMMKNYQASPTSIR